MKYCSKCGNANSDEAVFCSGCGSPLQQAPAAPQPAPAPAPEPAPEPTAYTAPAPQPTPQQGTYTTPAYDSSAYSAPAGGEVKNKATLWLILNIVSTVLCCSGVFGIIGIIMAAMGMGSFKRGEFEDMNKKSKIAMIMFIIGTVLGLIGEIVAIILIANGTINTLSDFPDFYNSFN